MDELFVNELSSARFQAALAIGLLDGLLGSVEFIYKAGSGITKGLWARLKGAASYVKDVTMLALREQSLKAAFDKVADDITESWKELKDKIIALRDFAATAIVALASNAKTLLLNVIQGIKDWVGDLLTGETGPAYDIGVLAFDLLLTVFTAGTGSAASFLPKITKAIKQLQHNVPDGITALFQSAAKKIDEGVVGATKFFRCKILMKGCFVKGTPVLMANNNYLPSVKSLIPSTSKSLALAAALPVVAVPIEEVKLLDFALAHTTVNAGYGLEANAINEDGDMYLGLMDKDPFTSDEQRARDEFGLDDEHWNEVVFEEMGGTSVAKLAQHDQWIRQKGYKLDAVVNMDLPEQGISGPFRITSIRHILPQKKPVDEDPGDDYEYRPVTGLFIHTTPSVWEIGFDNGDSLGVTHNHPIYSTSFGDWKPAGNLEIAERVLTRFGSAEVVSKTIGAGQRVYNLEVKELHNFLVGEGVVVHNACWKTVRKQLDELGVGTNNHRKMELPENHKRHKIDKPGSDDVAQKYNQDKIEICYDDLGFPDFNEWVPEVNGKKMEFQINMNGNNLTGSGTGDYGQAFDKMESILGVRPSSLSQIEVPGYSGIQWSLHHHQDGKTMQLVPKMINGNTPHVGGKSIMNKAKLKGIEHWLPGPSEISNYKSLCK